MNTPAPHRPAGAAVRGRMPVALVLALALANLLFLAWTAGWLGRPPGAPDRDPARLARQVRPDAVRVLAPAEAEAAMAEPSDAVVSTHQGVCLEAGPFEPADVALAEQLLEDALGPAAWSRHLAPDAGWAVVSGPHAGEEALARERRRIERAGLAFEPLADLPAAMPGFLLGRHATSQAAAAARDAAARRGVHAAHVVAFGDVSSTWLRVAGDDATLRQLLSPIETPVGGLPLGQRFVACAGETPD